MSLSKYAEECMKEAVKESNGCCTVKEYIINTISLIKEDFPDSEEIMGIKYWEECLESV